MENNKEIVITASNKWFDINLKEIWEYRDLIFNFVSRNFKVSYKQTILGPVWLLLNPLATSIIFTFIFGQFAGLSTDGVPQFLFYTAGTTLWNLCNSNTTSNSNIFVANAGVYGKIYFPRLTVPISQTISSVINFIIQFVALIIIFAIYAIKGDVSFSARMLLAPVFILHTAVLSVSIGLVASALCAKYRDFIYVMPLAVQLWMYITPVVYTMDTTGGWMYKLLLLNPMTSVMNNFKWAFLGSGQFMMGGWIFSLVLTAILATAGVVLFSKTEKTFIDTV
ncbi:MAG: ABC transporter permease [Oscillospiraceae bacterium]|nr:ABC transporter permease [Oscillospiraceae bacterium]MBQ5325605.1 ABC transporter permease [Oscillospiraceae bacterium]